MKTKPAPDIGSNLGEDDRTEPLGPPPGTMSVEDQIKALAAQISALTAVVAPVVTGSFAAAMEAARKAADLVPLPPVPKAPQDEKRIRIMLEDNDAIPPGGQFIQVQGFPYILMPGYEVDVPESILDVLDHAVMSVPVTDVDKQVVGYRDRLRFPYRVIRQRDAQEH